jgi:hypothetical protein
MDNVFGKAKFGGKGRNWFKLKDGSNGPYRILPPMGDLSERGTWHVFYSIHYGYKNSEGKIRTFVSPLIKNRKTKMVESPDAAFDRINQLKAKLDEAKKTGNNELATKLLELVGGKKSRYNLDSNHYLNVVDLQGNVGILKIRHRCKLALDAQIEGLRDAGIEPLNTETGRFFTFHRSGMGMDTVYSVSIYKKRLTIEGVGEVEQDVVHEITDDLARRCLTQNKDGSFTYKEAGRLDSLFAKPTSAQVERIVKEGEKAVDEILDGKAETTETDDSGFEEDGVQAATTPAASITETASKAVSATTAAVTTNYTIQSSKNEQVTPTVLLPNLGNGGSDGTGSSKSGYNATPAAAGSTAPKTTAQVTAEMSDEDYLKWLGI